LNRACQPPRDINSQSQSIVQKNERSQGVPDLMRILVLHRDQQRCVLCGRSSGEVSLEVAHIIPFSQGGNNDLDNLQTLCQDCHRDKGSHLF
jgi:5-methylcytosine-specific restriction endonuclease McrA